ACLVADALGMTKVLIHPFSSLLSAYGMGLADIRATRQQAVEEPFGDAALVSIARVGGRLAEDAGREVVAQGVAAQAVEVFIRAHIRYAGTDTALVVPAFSVPPAGAPLRPTNPGLDGLSLAEIKSDFEAAHKSRFGFIDDSKELVVEAVSVEAGGGGAGRGGRGGREVHRAGVADEECRAPLPRAPDQVLLARPMARGGGVHAPTAFPRSRRTRPGHHHRAASDHRGRGRLARRNH